MIIDSGSKKPELVASAPDAGLFMQPAVTRTTPH